MTVKKAILFIMVFSLLISCSAFFSNDRGPQGQIDIYINSGPARAVSGVPDFPVPPFSSVNIKVRSGASVIAQGTFSGTGPFSITVPQGSGYQVELIGQVDPDAERKTVFAKSYRGRADNVSVKNAPANVSLSLSLYETNIYGSPYSPDGGFIPMSVSRSLDDLGNTFFDENEGELYLQLGEGGRPPLFTYDEYGRFFALEFGYTIYCYEQQTMSPEIIVKYESDNWPEGVNDFINMAYDRKHSRLYSAAGYSDSDPRIGYFDLSQIDSSYPFTFINLNPEYGSLGNIYSDQLVIPMAVDGDSYVYLLTSDANYTAEGTKIVKFAPEGSETLVFQNESKNFEELNFLYEDLEVEPYIHPLMVQDMKVFGDYLYVVLASKKYDYYGSADYYGRVEVFRTSDLSRVTSGNGLGWESDELKPGIGEGTQDDRDAIIEWDYLYGSAMIAGFQEDSLFLYNFDNYRTIDNDTWITMYRMIRLDLGSHAITDPKEIYLAFF